MRALSSSIIDTISTLCATSNGFAWAYYFFDGRDSHKQRNFHEIVLRSLIRQIWDRCHGSIPVALVNLYEQFDKGGRQPPIQSLQAVLLAILHGFDQVFIIIDALDECQSRVELLLWLRDIANWKGGKLHLAVTGRPERDVIDVIKSLDRREVRVDADTENVDIQMYLDHQLQNETKLSRWPEDVRALIKAALTKGADGM